MKKQKLSELAKSKGIYAFLLVGVFVIVTAVLISVNNQSGQQENPNLVDLNEEPNNVAENQPYDQNATTSEENTAKDTLTANNDDLNVNNAPSNLPAKVAENGVSEAVDTKVADTAKTTEKATDTKETAKNTSKSEETKPVMNTTVKNLSFKEKNGLAWPIQGNIIMNYSVDRTIYHETLKQFKTNPAILIQAAAGTEVKAAAKGIVASIENDPVTGITITMEIGNSYKLVYGQMDETSLKVGDVVEEGKVIGKLAKVSKYYTVEGDNLYFQVINGEETVNPMLLLRAE